MPEAERANQSRARAESQDVPPRGSAWTTETNVTKNQQCTVHSDPTIHVSGDA